MPKLNRILSTYLQDRWGQFLITKKFWELRNAVHFSTFLFKKGLFLFRSRTRCLVDELHPFLLIFKHSLKMIFTTVLFFSLLSIAYPMLLSEYVFVKESIDSLKTAIFPHAVLHLTPEKYSDLMAGIASVSGAFLGLYFATISLGVGPLIHTTSSRVRRLLLEEKTGSRYVNLLSLLTGLSFSFWMEAATSGKTSLMCLSFVLALTLVLIGSFFPVGRYSFSFADPYTISMPIFKSLERIMGFVHNQGLWSDKSLDDYHRRLIVYDLQGIQEIISIAIAKGKQANQDLEKVTSNLLNSVFRYLRFKHTIPPESPWFVRKPQYHNWLVESDINQNLLQNTGVVPTPQMEPNPNWYEENIFRLISITTNSFVCQKDVNSLTNHLQIVGAAIDVFSANVKSSFVGWMLNWMKNEGQKLAEEATILLQDRLGLVEVVLLQRTKVIASYIKFCTNEDLGVLVTNISEHVSQQRRSLPKVPFPQMLNQIQDLKKKIENEISIEGKQISPKWYIEQRIADFLLYHLRQYFNELHKLLEFNIYTKPNASFDSAAIGMVCTQGAISSTTKILYLHQSLETLCKKLRDQFIKTDDSLIHLRITIPGTAALQHTLSGCYKKIGSLIVPLYGEDRPKDFPDLFGLAYVQLLEEVFEVIRRNHHVNLQTLIQPVIVAAVQARQRLEIEFKDADPTIKAHVVLDPIIDVFELSGYAALYSELHNDSVLFEVVSEAWIKLDFDWQWAMQVLDFFRSDIKMTRGYHSRFQWKNALRKDLQGKGYALEHYARAFGKRQTLPQSPWLKTIIDIGFDFSDSVADVFVSIASRRSDPNRQYTYNSRFWRSIENSANLQPIGKL